MVVASLSCSRGSAASAIGLERAGWQVVLGNQWEPSTRVQHAFDCYDRHFGDSGSEDVNDDIAEVLDAVERGERTLPAFDLLVGGFPCQDYSVAKLLNQAHGIQGKKGVLWWQIHRLLEMSRPPLVFLENVDRLLKSPATQRGRDFAIMLASSRITRLHRRVARHQRGRLRLPTASPAGLHRRAARIGRRPLRGADILYSDGVLARAFPVVPTEEGTLFDGGSTPGLPSESRPRPPHGVVRRRRQRSPFENGGVMIGGAVWTRRLEADFDGHRVLLGDILQDEADVPPEYFIPEEQLDAWRYLKGAKREERVHKASGTAYCYSEGPLPFPDPLDRPARTVLTAEGGTSPSRFKHVVQTPSGRFRRLTPVELERINGFPDGWTEGMTPGKRAFCMGNALVVGAVERVGRVLADELARVTIPA